jgi:hypothetical protein
MIDFALIATNENIEKICQMKDNILFLNQKSDVIDNIRIVGCTLWTYIPMEEEQNAMSSMNDYRQITVKNEGNRRLNPKDTCGMHCKQVEWIEQEIKIAKELGQKVVILTHHCPLLDIACAHPSELGSKAMDSFQFGFGTDLRHLLHLPVVGWLYGHTHWFQDMVIQGVRVASNPHGYPKEAEPNSYDPTKFVSF